MRAAPEVQHSTQRLPRVRSGGRSSEAVRGGEAGRGEATARLLGEVAATDDLAEKKMLQDEVVVINMGVARAIASRYRDRGIGRDDLLQAAYLGLVKAVQGFDPSFGRDFLRYAVPTITGEVKRYFRDFGWAVRPPRRVQELQALISGATNELCQSLGRSPKPSELAIHLDLEVEHVVEALAADGCFAPSSLDVPVGDHGSVSRADLLNGGDEDEDLARVEIRLLLAPALRALGPRDRRILARRFCDGWTQEQIGEEIGVSQMQVSRLLTQLLGTLRERLD